jgi:hypothetical protein
MKPQLHQSMIGTLSHCGIQFQRRYGSRFNVWHEEEVQPPGIALVTGISVHKSVERNLSSKIETGELLSLSEVKQIARDSFEAERSGGMMFTEEEAIDLNKTVGAAIDQTVSLAEIHAIQLAPTLVPVAVEERFVLELKDYSFDLAGTKDVRESDGTIRDTKTKASTPSADDVLSFQMGTYSLAEQVRTGSLPPKVAVDTLVKTKTPKLVTHEAVPTEENIRPIKRRIDHFAQLIDAAQKGHQAFTPADPNSWICTRKFCGYSATCPFASGR